MRTWWIISGAVILLTRAVDATDLSQIDKTIRKEPPYKTKPGYALLVFGSEAKTRVWLVQDGEKIFVDRNADGDLTDPAEAIEPSKVRVANSSYRDKEYVI